MADARRGARAPRAGLAGDDSGVVKSSGDREIVDDGATDARCLVVDYGKQGIRFKEGRALVSEV